MAAGMEPATVLIIRHAEKPQDTSNPHLSWRGQDRAKGLAQRLPARFPRIAFLFAAASTPKSYRPVETLFPLSDEIRRLIDVRFNSENPELLAQEIRYGEAYLGQTVLISWRHESAGDLARNLGAQLAPQSWPADVFDRIWQIEYGDAGVAFRNLPQCVLPGDSRS